ncbi:MAG: aminopeptidase P family protein [Erysipelothrix sp.]|nr:aminopeptidase P family protein [Erysipelothrix sp.]
MKRIQKQLKNKTLIISDPISIQYFTGYKNEPQERLMALLITETNHTLIINEMFPKPTGINYKTYQDSDNPVKTLNKLISTETILIDGHLPSRFLIPIISPNRIIKDGSSLINDIRNIKTPTEIEKMRIASKHNDRIMQEVIESIHEGITEREITETIKQKQSTSPLSGISFEPIAAFSENIADPHANATDRSLKKGDVILIDMGGIYQNYHSDMTRTFFYGENETIEKLYNIVLKANKAAINAIKIGVPLSHVDKAAREVIEKAGYGPHFTHRTGHGIGLETHEPLDVSSSNETIIKPGMCFSIEPGIYIQGVGGVRIEDLICVKDDEIIVLNQFPKQKMNLIK